MIAAVHLSEVASDHSISFYALTVGRAANIANMTLPNPGAHRFPSMEAAIWEGLKPFLNADTCWQAINRGQIELLDRDQHPGGKFTVQELIDEVQFAVMSVDGISLTPRWL